MKYIIGIDLGGTNIAVGILDEKMNILEKESRPTLVGERPAEGIVTDMAEMCQSLCKKKGIAVADLIGIGIVSPGVVDEDRGWVLYAANMKFTDFPLVPMLCEKLNLNKNKVFIANDANAAAWGEAVIGAAKGSKSSMMVTLGTGVGGGFVDNGKLFTGFNGAACELGHYVLQVGGRPCTCGRKGCWEAYSSATGLINMTKEKLAECEKIGRKTLMTDIVKEAGKVSGRTAFQAKRQGDDAASEVVEEYVTYLASGLGSMINLFRPEVLSIGGGISNEGDYLLKLLQEKVDAETFAVDHTLRTKLCIAQLKNDAGIVGGATLCLPAEA